MKRKLYDLDADVEFPDPMEETEAGEEVDTVDELDEDECEAVAAVLGFDPRELEDEDE